ncbi:hypothetical protein FGG08_002553 [Glutinoglossum americanum]|uniref:Uncharacterized protein n=1 Tax=Glutinoglossum americanum TaxID=1670608 RepID=A0A9P8IBG6_9PEZI|nr:hypothetical protein FGG08_002553 [Glutinoglossum americanum]
MAWAWDIPATPTSESGQKADGVVERARISKSSLFEKTGRAELAEHPRRLHREFVISKRRSDCLQKSLIASLNSIPLIRMASNGDFKWKMTPTGYLDPDQIKNAEALARFSLKAERLPPNRTITEGITKYLKALRERARDCMALTWGEEFVNGMPIEHILTVPAIWSDRAKAQTLYCATEAGLVGAGGRGPRLISEPEAAALYTFTTVPSSKLRPGEVFLVCDAGGGTVDLTTYEIIKNNPLEVKEAAVGSGGVCGSVMLNQRFADLVKGKLGTWLNGSRLRDEVNIIKPLFDGDDRVFRIQVPAGVPDDPAVGITSGHLEITPSDLRKIFDPVIGAVVMLIFQQNAAVTSHGGDRVAAILLVGGFGGSAYLKKQIEARVAGVAVSQPPEAWSAVVRGALLRILNGAGIVQTRKIRAHYGISHKEPWTVEKHERGSLRTLAGLHRNYDAYEEKDFCEGRMMWYVKKGDEFSEDRTKSFTFYRTFGINSSFRPEIDLFIFTDGDEGGEGPSFKDGDCRVVATLKPDLSVINKSELQTFRSKAGEYYKVSYELEMSFEAAIAFKLKYQGVVQAPAQPALTLDGQLGEGGGAMRSGIGQKKRLESLSLGGNISRDGGSVPTALSSTAWYLGYPQ